MNKRKGCKMPKNGKGYNARGSKKSGGSGKKKTPKKY